MLRYLSISILLCLWQSTTAQTLQQIAPLLPPITEASGLQFVSENTMLTHNDSGDGPFLFWIDKMGVVLDSIELPLNAFDWEDLAEDGDGNIYIGDFGNNFNNRQNLAIHCCKNISPETDSFDLSTISFYYPDQTEFPPPFEELNFDCEAMIHHQDALFLFSKNRGVSNYTKCYQLPDTAGNYEAILIDSFDTGGWITGATFNSQLNQLVLLSEIFIWVFYDFEGTDFFGGKSKQISFPFSKKEGVSFDAEGDLWMVDDPEITAFQGYLWKMEGPLVGQQSIQLSKLKVYPSPANTSLTFEYDLDNSEILFLYNSIGQFVQAIILNPESKKKVITTENLVTGIYHYRLGNKSGRFFVK